MVEKVLVHLYIAPRRLSNCSYVLANELDLGFKIWVFGCCEREGKLK